MNTIIKCCHAVCAVLLSLQGIAQNIEVTIPLDTFTVRPWIESRPDGHEPAALMGSHVHDKGVWMFSYSFSLMMMEGNIQGHSEYVDDKDIFSSYMASPETMRMRMHMLGLMYGARPGLTLMLMLGYMEINMESLSRMSNKSFSIATHGPGDLGIHVLLKLAEWRHHKLIGDAGLSMPTGSLEQRDNTPMGNEVKLPYVMQTGSGTFDLLPKITFVSQSQKWSTGSQSFAILRTGKNEHAYRLGNKYVWTSWISRKFNKWISASARLEGLLEETISGMDDEIEPMMSPAANPLNYGGKYMTGFAGVNIYIPGGLLERLRLHVEYGLPVYGNTNGIQMKRKQSVMISMQWQTG